MTRFARAKGSKASNERVAEEATPWSELKQQLLEKNKEIEENKKRKDVLEKRNATYKAFLEEKEKDDNKNASWAEFPGTQNLTIKGSKAKKANVSSTNNTPKQDYKKTLEQEENNIFKQGAVSNTTESDSDEPPEEHSSKKEITEPIVPKKKKLKSKKPLKITLQQGNRNGNDEGHKISEPTGKRKAVDNVEGAKKKIKKTNQNKVNSNESDKNPNDTKQKNKIIKENLTENDLKNIEKKRQKRHKQVEKKKLKKAALKKQKEEEERKAKEDGEVKTNDPQTETSGAIKTFNKTSNAITYPKKTFNEPNKFTEKKKKVRDNAEHPRKKPLLPHKMFINGKELEIDYVDGFPVKKEDAERLKKLRKEMISKGLPRSEINIALKLERRKAEKAFAREKKKVCFHCRKSGHNLSECPNIDKNEIAQTSASGICFKCGSTEHTHFECKVVRGQEFKYATCFICKEQGHIARQCPDNARGMYPKGGACKVCGDVTHLKKDCPKYQAQQQKQEEGLMVETVGGNNPDILEEKSSDRVGLPSKKKHNKIIKF